MCNGATKEILQFFFNFFNYINLIGSEAWTK